MTTWYINNSDGRAPWVANTAYSTGNRCCSRIEQTDWLRRTRVYECTTAGTSHATTEPTWNTTVGGTTNDGTVVWTTRQNTSWDNAHPCFTLWCDYTQVAPGESVLVHDAHNENVGTADGRYYWQMANAFSETNPIIIKCVDKDNSDALSTGAIIRNQRSEKRITTNMHVICINIQFIFDGKFSFTGNGINSVLFTMVSTGSPIDLITLNASGAYIYLFNYASNIHLKLINGNLNYQAADNYIDLLGCKFEWFGGSLVAPNGVTALIKPRSYGGVADIRDVDLSAIGANDLVGMSGREGAPTLLTFTRCKLPGTLTGILDSAYQAYGDQGCIKLHHCSAADSTWEFYEQSRAGLVSVETSIVRDGGASDGVQDISWKVVSSAYVTELGSPLKLPEICLWNTSVAEITLTVHLIIDSATHLQDDEVWLEVSYPADDSSGLGAYATTRKLKGIETVADLTASTETWDGTGGMTNPHKWQLSATFTPGKIGPITARVCVGKPSTTLYVCPKAVIS